MNGLFSQMVKYELYRVALIAFYLMAMQGNMGVDHRRVSDFEFMKPDLSDIEFHTNHEFCEYIEYQEIYKCLKLELNICSQNCALMM